MRQRAFAALFAVLVVTAMLPAGLATAQEQPTSYDRTFTDGQELIGVNTGNFSGDFTFQVTAGDAPGDTITLYQEGYNVGESAQLIYFRNAGAYDNITVSVIPTGGNSGAPDLIDGNEAPTVGSRHITASTGGDADLTCDPGEKINTMVNPLSHIVDCHKPLPGAGQVNTTGTDAVQTKQDIYQSAVNQEAGIEGYETSLDNRLEDAKTVARIKGKNAYIRALNNGSSDSAARLAAKEAVRDHYAVIQHNYAQQWNKKLTHGEYLRTLAANESGIDQNVTFRNTDNITVDGMGVEYHDPNDQMDEPQQYTHSTASKTLVNGSTVDVQQFQYRLETDGGVHWVVTRVAGMHAENVQVSDFDDGVSGSGEVTGISFVAPNSDEEIQYIDFGAAGERWDLIESQSQTVTGEMDTLANNTYEAYQNGEINNSDLIDPYVLASEYSPGSEYQGWAAAQLTLLGQNSPEAMDQIGRFNVTTSSGQYSGVLFSQENPASGQFETNATYDPSAINGTQYVVTDESIEELDSNFTIDSITTHDGEKRQNVTIVEKTYETTNTTELKQLYEDLAYERAQIEAREKALEADGGGGGGLFPNGDVPPGVALGFVAAIVLLALARE